MSDAPLKPIVTFDPTDDGWAPMSLAEVLEAGEAASAAVAAFQLALHACTTPLNFRPMAKELTAVTESLGTQVEILAEARRIVESDTPLAIRYQGKDPWADESGGILSPKQVASLARRAQSVRPSAHTTYRAAMESSPAVPTLIDADRALGFNAAGLTTLAEVVEGRREIRTEAARALKEDLEKTDCAYCHAPAGSPCVTNTGKEASLSHRPRHDASSLSTLYPWSPKVQGKPQAAAAEYLKVEGLSPAATATYSEVGQLRSAPAVNTRQAARRQVSEAVGSLARTLTDLDR